jgi:hypothetical protein
MHTKLQGNYLEIGRQEERGGWEKAKRVFYGIKPEKELLGIKN